MILDGRLCTAIVAIHEGFGVLEFWRHGLRFNGSFQVSELPFHVDYTPAADRTPVGTFLMFVIAPMMYAVATRHENYGLWRGEHVFTTNRTVTISRPFYTAVRVSNRD